jgi:hypothetical protein
MTTRDGFGTRGWAPTAEQVREPCLLIRVVRDLFPERTGGAAATWGDVVAFRGHPQTTLPDIDAVLEEYERRLAIVTRALTAYAHLTGRAA